VHVSDYQRIPADHMAEVRQLVSKVYARIGVRVVWTTSTERELELVGAYADLVVLSAAMVDRQQAVPNAFGVASHVTRRAYIYYDRIQAHAMRTNGDPSRVLALVVAHELGHVLLPEYSHVKDGLMRPDIRGQVRHIPDFLPAQASTIRTLLSGPFIEAAAH
jgi:hypothetical protein